MRCKNGVVHGRFQVLHNDHLAYIMAGKDQCDVLVVGICNADPSVTKPEPTSLARHNPSANPCTYFERYLMIECALLAQGLAHSEFKIVPFPINVPELIHYYVPHDAAFFLTINDQWGYTKLERLKRLGLKTHVLWERLGPEKGICGTTVRAAIAASRPWEHYVPPTTVAVVRDCGIDLRIRSGGADSVATC